MVAPMVKPKHIHSTSTSLPADWVLFAVMSAIRWVQQSHLLLTIHSLMMIRLVAMCLVEGSAEILFPLPFVEDRRSIKSAFFIDAGNVYNSDCQPFSISCEDLDFAELRYSAGVSVTWITGFAPISFSLGVPLNDKPGDDTEVFQFELGKTL